LKFYSIPFFFLVYSYQNFLVKKTILKSSIALERNMVKLVLTQKFKSQEILWKIRKY
jgi:translation initiation factor 2 beta subunit (eIF-2beta)/eIF-5